MSIVLTEKAAHEVKRIMEAQKYEDHVLRVGVAGGGCSGFSYALGFAKDYDEAVDSKYEFHGVPVVVDKKSALYLDEFAVRKSAAQLVNVPHGEPPSCNEGRRTHRD